MVRVRMALPSNATITLQGKICLFHLFVVVKKETEKVPNREVTYLPLDL